MHERIKTEWRIKQEGAEIVIQYRHLNRFDHYGRIFEQYTPWNYETKSWSENVLLFKTMAAASRAIKRRVARSFLKVPKR